MQHLVETNFIHANRIDSLIRRTDEIIAFLVGPRPKASPAKPESESYGVLAQISDTSNLVGLNLNELESNIDMLEEVLGSNQSTVPGKVGR